jgi:ribosome biogenesis GTPase
LYFLINTIMEYSGVVIKSTGSWYTVDTGDNIVNCRIKGRFKISDIKTTNPVAVGDKVKFIMIENDDAGLITEILPRENFIIRKATKLSKSSHIIASNIDRCIVIATVAKPKTSTGFIDRLLTTAEAYHIPSIIVFNKYDLYDEEELARLHHLIKMYYSVGYPVIITSTKTNKGLDKFKHALQNKVSLLTGHSGVGKSALINCIQPNLNLKEGEISQTYEKGKHTTTFATMYKLTFGGYIIDTPGIKEFGLTNFDRAEVADRFPEMRKYRNKCKFNNCTHTNEPDCAVLEAVAKNEIYEERYINYLNILEDDYFDE